jgi:hypothetical protein
MASLEMVYSACVAWFEDWISVSPPTLNDEWDLAQWMETDMKDATQMFLREAFHTVRARNDALMILRSLYYEYYLFERARALAALTLNPDPTVRLPALPQSAQKSAQWHAESREMLSGHEFGAVCEGIGTPSEFQTAVAKKCAPERFIDETAETESRTVYLTSEEGALSAFKWGWRYEPVARDLFERVFAGGKVFDGLGRVRHPSISRLGASPDGLIMDGEKQGRLLELKCPTSRELTKSIPLQYFAQMQLQAEVCDVQAVEYFEIKFAAKPKDQVTPEYRTSGKHPWMGVICVTAPTEETLPADYTYEYSPLFPTTEEGFAATMAWTPNHPVVHETSVWTVKDWGHHTVLRNPRWWVDVGYPGYQRFWKAVETARHDGTYKPKILLLERKPSTTRDGSDTAETPRRVRDAVVEMGAATTGVDERAVEPVAETGETKSSN